MTRWLAMLAAALALAYAANAGAQTRAPKARPPAPAQKKVHELPLHLYLAKGEANACGEGCSEWIAVEGMFDAGAAGRAQAFLKRHGARKLPVYLHSPGGHSDAAIAIGRQLRQLGLTAGVGVTVPRGCESASDQSTTCRAAKRTNQPVAADWRADGTCSSACVWTLLGAKSRHVSPGARLGVHATKYTLMLKHSSGKVQQVSPQQALHKTRAAQAIAATRSYIRAMGIDPTLLDVAQKVPHEDVYYLTRDEIAAFGIDRRDFAETPWFFVRFPSGNAYVSKWIVEARGPDRKEHRISVVLLRCLSPTRVSMQFVRGLASDEIQRPATAIFSIGKQKLRLSLSGASKRDTIETGGTFSTGVSSVLLTELEAAAASNAAIRMTEADPRLDTKLYNVVELSTHGLAASLKPLREKCAPPVQIPPALPAPPSWGKGTGVPFTDPEASKKNSSSPPGIYLQPDWKPPRRARQ